MNTINNKLNTFHKLKLIKCHKIDKTYNNNMTILNNLSNDLIKISYLDDKPFEYSIIPEFNLEFNKIKKNNINNIKFTKKKTFSLNKNRKRILFDENKAKKFLNNKLKLYNQNNLNSQNKLSSNNNYTYYKNQSLENKTISHISHIDIKNKNNIKYIKKKILNNQFNKKILNSKILANHSNKNEINKNKNSKIDNNLHFSFNNENKYKTNSMDKIFMTEQKSENKNIKDKKDKYKGVHLNKNLIKAISKKNLTNFINTSSELYRKQLINLKKINENIISGRKNFYNIKMLLQKLNMKESIKKELDYLVNEDIDITKIYKTMRLFHNSFKSEITINKGDIIKNIMITKKNADIINYCDYYCNMDDLYFYKYNKSFIHNYPILSQKARKESFHKDYNKMEYHSYINIIEGNAVNIRKLFKSCMKTLNKIKNI